MERATGKTAVYDAIVEENDLLVRAVLEHLNFTIETKAEQIHEALMRKIRENDTALSEYLHRPACTTREGCETVIGLANTIAGKPKGFFLKREIAERLLRLNPPKNLLRELGLDSIDALLKEFSLEEIFPAVRFAEDRRWLNEVFFHPYASLTPEDFEQREVRVLVLPQRFREIGKQFSGKKLHHISHLKELGVIFVMPVAGDDHAAPPGATLEILTLVLHYLQEVPFYSRIFQRFAREPKTFAHHVMSALRGDVLPQIPDHGFTEGKFLIVQRYLAKEDPSDPRLFAPHMNPEASHWKAVEKKLDAFGVQHPELQVHFWKGLDFTGDFFPLDASEAEYLMHGVREETLISFDLIDNLISHNRNSPVLEKYLYHQQEALWNKLFATFLGEEQSEALVEEHIEQGFIELKPQ